MIRIDEKNDRMDNMYELLKKHFNKETTPEEEELIAAYKRRSLQEYTLLKHLWWSNLQVQIKDFDSNTAWAKVIAEANNKRRKTISLVTKIRRVAAIAILLIAGAFTIYWLAKPNIPAELRVATNQTTEGEKIILNDGSIVWLNRNATLCYPEEFNGKTRVVKLEGEAFFEVAKNPKKPFVVETGLSTVTVLGTTFNINTHSLQTDVTVATGKVNVKSAYSATSVTLLPNEMAVATKMGIVKSQITNPNYLSWKTGVFLFEDTPLKDVVRDLNTFYDQSIVLNITNQEQLFSAHFDNAKLEDIIEILEITLTLNIQKTPNTYEIN
jgi:ferric-dicitrate binding protein FerR (iron transport regulator)